MTTVVNIYRDAYDVFIGRSRTIEGGAFGNPYPVGQICSRCRKLHSDAASTLPCFAAYLDERTRREPVFCAQVLGLRGKRLACYCKKGGGEPCHGDVIAQWLDGDRAQWRKRWGLA